MRLALPLAAVIALAAPGAALAEAVPGASTNAVLAVAADGTPRVASEAGGRLTIAARDASGSWSTLRTAALPGAGVLLEGIAVEPSGAVDVLVGDAHGRWLALADANGVHVLARPAKTATLGVAGLTLDRAGRPVVAYATLVAARRHTFLRLARRTAAGRYVATAITKLGFPITNGVPSADPVLMPDGSIRVVETFPSSAIEWSPRGRDWQGQFLFIDGLHLGAPAGPVNAVAAAGGVYSAWTELYPSYGVSDVLLVLHLDGEHQSVLHRHAFLVSLVIGPQGPEIAANDYAELGESLDFAALVLDGSGNALELDGRIVGYAVDATGARQLLLAGPGGLQWLRAPVLPTLQVSLAAAASNGQVALSGRVAGASGGTVALYREQRDGLRTLVATVPLGADGSFVATDSVPSTPSTYRAVYVDATTGLPLASLVRTPVQTR
jgi:hypothetical protein